MPPKLFNVYIIEVITQWQNVLTKDFKIDNTLLNTILFADDQAIFSESEDCLQRAVSKLENTANGFNMRISTTKTESLAF
jgi:hypothetical protein